MADLSGIGSIVQGGASLGGLIAGAIQSNQNLNFQKEQFAYQKQLNDMYMDRMDNKLQYLVKDAKKAGINPLAAIGQAGGYSTQSSAPAPQMDTSYLQHLDKLGDSVNQAILNSKTVSDTKVAMAQANQLNAQTLNTTADTEVKNATKKQLLHDLKVANQLNAPIGVYPDMYRALFNDVKSYVVNKFNKSPDDKFLEKYGDYEYKEKKPNNYDSGLDAKVESIIDHMAGDSIFNKARHWLGDKIKTFNKAMVDAENRDNKRRYEKVQRLKNKKK